MKHKRTLQEIFDAVIDGGFYPHSMLIRSSSDFMCSALILAASKGKITEEERKRAKKSIQLYMIKLYPGNMMDITSLFTLIDIWREASIIPERISKSEKLWIPRTLAVYKNWANRPYRPYTRGRASYISTKALKAIKIE